ncbi:MAG: zf-TFIIB domain-containing protein [Candidatus Binatia bacterium]
MVERDSFGDKLRDKEKVEEDRYFAERDKAALEKLRGAKAAEQEAAVRELAKGRCPKDGSRLAARSEDGVEIDECGTCGGVWLDAGELKALSKREGEGWVGRMFRGRG